MVYDAIPAMLCHAVVLCHIITYYAMLSILIQYVAFCYALFYAVLCYSMLCYAMLCYAMLCHAILGNDML